MYFNLDITNKEQEIKNYRPLKTNDVSIHELVHSLLTKHNKIFSEWLLLNNTPVS